jgi:hypothetical protein
LWIYTVKLSPGDIKWAHVEASSKCNAWCPACVRNNHGFGLADHVVEQDLSPDLFESIISAMPNLHGIQLCGNLGDPIASSKINDIISISIKYSKKIQIHTNGSLRNTDWWAQLASQLSQIDHDVWFGIDGLEGVHEIYRQGTSFKKIIKNATAFIHNGGNATWQFIPYKHNEHQVLECLKLSQHLKFKKFKLANLYRNQTLARHYKTGEEFNLEPTKSMQRLIKIHRSKPVKPNNCMHISMPSIYISASGNISRCCYFWSKEQSNDINDFFKNINADLSAQICIQNCGESET